MAALPTPGGSDGTWGDELNTWLEVEHEADGTHALDAAAITSDTLDSARLDSDLAEIAGLSPTNDDIVQRKSGSWTNRTLAQVAADLAPKLQGYELAYAEITSDVTVSATTEGGADDVISSGAVSYDGSPVIIEFYTPQLKLGTSAYCFLVLQDGATVIGWMALAQQEVGAVAIHEPVLIRGKLTPSAGSHTYKITAYRGTANCTVKAGSGGSGAFLPAYIRVTKA